MAPGGRTAGSGKTVLAIRLTLGLLALRANPADLVPVIFSLGSWDPSADSLLAWMADSLVRDHPGLSAPGPHGVALARELVNAGRILPVLDGFDELAEGIRRKALMELNAMTIAAVLTSRPAAYAETASKVGVFGASASIELLDLSLPDVVHYLPRTTPRGVTDSRVATSWNSVLARMTCARGRS